MAADGLIPLFRFEISNTPSAIQTDTTSSTTSSAGQVRVPDLIAKQIQSLCFRAARTSGTYKYLSHILHPYNVDIDISMHINTDVYIQFTSILLSMIKSKQII